MPITSLTPSGRLAIHILREAAMPMSTLHLAQECGATAQSMTHTLQWLAKNGHIQRQKFGARTYYWVPLPESAGLQSGESQ